MAMQLTLPPDIEALVENRMATGAYTDVEDLLRCALEVLVEEEHSLTPEEVAHIEEGCQQALRGEVKSGEQVRRDMVEFKRHWLRERALK